MQRSNFIFQLVISAVLLGIVAGLCCLVPRLGCLVPRLGSLDAVLAAAILLSLLVGAVNGYCYIIGATRTSLTFAPGGLVVWMLARRGMGYFVIIVLAFLFSLCFVIHVPSLNPIGFVFIFLTVPLFAGVYYCFRKIFEGESVDWLTTGRSLWCSLLATPFLMVLLYGLFLNHSGFVPVYDNLQAAIDAQPKPWENANSEHIRQAGEWSVLWGACRDFGVGQLIQINWYIAVILVALGYWALFFNICSILAVCYVPLREYKRLLVPLTPSLELPKIAPRQYLSLCPMLIALVLLCSALFIWEKRDVVIIPDPEPVKVVLIKIGDSVFHPDVKLCLAELQEKHREELDRVLAGPLGKLEGFQGTLTRFSEQREELQNRLTGLRNNTFLELKKLHEEELFPRIERNVDAYLDWYYSITAEYIRLGNLVAGNIEEHMRATLREYLMRNVDFRRAEGIMNRFSEESGRIAAQIALIEELTKQLLEQAAEASEEIARIKEEYQIRWEQEVAVIMAENEVIPQEDEGITIVIDSEYASMEDFLESFQGISLELATLMERFEAYTIEMQNLLTLFTHHYNEHLSFNDRLFAANAAGIAGMGSGAAIGVRIATRITRNQAFRIAVEAVAKMAVRRTLGVGGGAGAGAAVGAGVGSVVPVVGTAAGAVVGGVAGGVAAWIATDYVFIRLEEHISRERFRREILSGVNAQRTEIIRALENVFQVNRRTPTQPPTQTPIL